MAVTEYYVDPNAGNDTTGNGTIGTPWKTVQKALNTISRNSTDGDRINVKAGTADTLGAALSYATFGTPTAAGQLIIQGYTSVAGDGGIGEIDGAATYGISGATWTYVTFADMKIGNCGSADVLDFGTNSTAINCEIHTSSGFGVDCGTGSLIVGCWFHDLTGTQAIDAATQFRVLYCYFDVSVTSAVIDGGSGGLILGNIIDVSGDDTAVYGIDSDQSGMTIIGNTVFCSNANIQSGIRITGSITIALNNIVEGWSGDGGDGIEQSIYNSFVGANAVYNCTNPYTLTSSELNYAIAPNDTLSVSPFTDATNNDFSIKDAQTGVTEDAYPSSFRGL